MQFFTVTDESSVKHKILVIPLTDNQMNQLIGQCDKCIPSLSLSAIVQNSHPYVVVDFGVGGPMRTAIALDDVSEDGHKIGDELAVGDALTVILTSESKSKVVTSEGGKVFLNVPLTEVLAFSFLYTADMAENYALYKMAKQSVAR